MRGNSILPKFVFDWKGGLALFLGAVLPVTLLSVANVVAMMFFKQNFQYSDFFLVLSNLLLWLGAILSFDFFICRPQTGKPLNFNFSAKNVSTYLLVFPLMFGMMLVAEFLTGKIPVTGPFFGELYEVFAEIMNSLSDDIPTLILFTCVMAPLFEEIVFRGIIQKGLINRGVKPINAIWFAAIVFGVVHGNPWQFLGALLLGYVLGLVYYRTKSLLMPILLHAFNNLASCLLVIYTGQESFSDVFGVSEYITLAAGIAIFAVFYYLFTEKYEILHSEN